MKNKAKQFVAKHWRSTLSFFAIISTLGALFLPKLGSLVAGHSKYEQAAYLGVDSKDALLSDIAFAPLKAAQAVMVKLDDPNATLLRLLSVAVALTAVVALYWLLLRWHTRRIALITCLLFASSSYVLHLARFSGQEVMYLLVVPIFLLISAWFRTKKDAHKLPLATLLTGLLLYIPGIFFFVVILSVAFRKRLVLVWKFVSKKNRAVSLFALLLTLSPLVYSLVKFPHQIVDMLGLSRISGGDTKGALQTLTSLPADLFWHGPNDPSRWLSGTPILDISTAILVLLGVYAYKTGLHPLRARLLVVFILLGVVLIAISTPATIAVILPAIYILAGNGTAYLLQSWFTVFPRNPIARSFGIILICIVIAMIASYHIKRYYVAWPNSNETKQALDVTIK